MSSIEIQQAIMNLPKTDYARLRNWIFEHDWQEWAESLKRT